ncbi:MAG: hypothetical protein ABR574_02515 [Cryomorphaceae bacterium]|nr:hypothetical protein [Flavobacteriales bacterium]
MISRNLRLGIAFLALPAVILYSCGESGKPDSDITESEVSADTLSASSDENVNKVQEIFYAVPSPMEMASILKKTGASYDMELLNDVKKVNEYTTSRSQALNLGVYGANLSYASIFNQNQESIIYLSCTKKLAEKLGVTKAFNESAIERMEANIENRDSLLNIVSETYYMLDAYLKENDRDHISAMVIAAGWVEGLYLSTSIAKKSEQKDKKLITRIAEQKLSLENLMDLVEAYNSSGQLDDIANDLKAIHDAYRDVEYKKGESGSGKTESGTPVLGSKTSISMSDESLQNITEVVAEIRARYVS